MAQVPFSRPPPGFAVPPYAAQSLPGYGYGYPQLGLPPQQPPPPFWPPNVGPWVRPPLATAPPAVPQPLDNGAMDVDMEVDPEDASTSDKPAAAASSIAPDKRELAERQEARKQHKQQELDKKRTAATKKNLPLTLPPKVERPERKSDWFMAKLKYKNALPNLPFDPKFAVYPYDPLRFVRYATTSLERNFKSTMQTEPKMGINIDLVDMDVFRPLSQRPTLVPEDVILAEDDVDKVDKKSKQERTVSVPWLRRTEYIAAAFTSNAPVNNRAVQNSSQSNNPTKELTNEEKIQLIKRTFDVDETLQTTEVKHPTKPNLKANEFLPVFPDFNLWGNDYVICSYPKSMPQNGVLIDPVQGGLMDNKETDKKRSTRLFCVPSHQPEDDEDIFDKEQEYVVQSEYSVKSESSLSIQRQYVFLLREGMAVFYNECPVQLNMIDLKAGPQRHDARPSVVKVKRHKTTHHEQAKRDEKTLKALQLDEADLTD